MAAARPLTGASTPLLRSRNQLRPRHRSVTHPRSSAASDAGAQSANGSRWAITIETDGFSVRAHTYVETTRTLGATENRDH